MNKCIESYDLLCFIYSFFLYKRDIYFYHLLIHNLLLLQKYIFYENNEDIIIK